VHVAVKDHAAALAAYEESLGGVGAVDGPNRASKKDRASLAIPEVKR